MKGLKRVDWGGSRRHLSYGGFTDMTVKTLTYDGIHGFVGNGESC